MILTAYLFLMALLNRARGTRLFEHTSSTVIGRVVSMGGMVLVSWLAFPIGIYEVLVIWAGLMLWCSAGGWGKYFSAMHGKYDPNEHEIAWIDWAGTYVEMTDECSNRLRGLFCMCLRGIYMYPIFIGLGLLGHPWAFIIGLGSLLQGFPYYWARYIPNWDKYGIMAAELVWGAWIGMMLYFV